MPKVYIDEVVPKGSIYPLIVNFQNGYATDEFQSKHCLLLRDKRNNEKTVLTEVAGLVYTGNEEREDLGRTLLLTRNKITGKVRLLEVANAELKPVLKTYKDKSSSELDTSYLELSRKFGSKKQKKQVEHKEKLKVNVQTVTEQMNNVTVNITEDQLDLSSYIKTDSDNFYIPPINRQADKAEDVYDLYKILSKEQYDQIFSEMEENNYTQELPEWLQQMVKSKLSEEHAVLLLYASALFKMSSIVVKEIGKKNFRICTSSGTLDYIVLKNFTTLVNGRRNRPMQYKDKAFCHALVFLLLVNNMKCDVDEISKNTKYSAKTLLTKFRVLGATIVTSGGKKTAQLKLPLSTVSRGRRKSAKF